jgi:hypothetical protein
MVVVTVTDRSDMPNSARRRFTLLDAMILVAATALGFAIAQWIGHATDGEVSWGALRESFRECLDQYTGKDRLGVTQEAAFLGLLTAWLIMPLGAMWTLALIPIRLLGPRPGLRRLARQPGMMATFAAGATIVFLGLCVMVAVLLAEPTVIDLLSVSTSGACFCAPMFVGWSVLISWTSLLLGRRWSAEATWVDRLGRAAGLCWIVTGFAVASLFVFYPFMSSCQMRLVVPAATPAAGATAQPLPLEPAEL